MMNHLEYKRTLTAEQAIEEELILCHLGTLESFESPWEALNALMLWHQNVGEYFAKKEGVMNDTSDLSKQPALRKWQKSTYGKGPYQVPDYESMAAIVQEHERMAACMERLTEKIERMKQPVNEQENWNELQKQIKRFRSFKERTGASKNSSYGVSINFDGYDNDAVLVEFGGYDIGDWCRVERIETTWDNLVEDFTKKIDEADEATKYDI